MNRETDVPAIPLARVLGDEGLRLFFPLAALYAAIWPLQWVLAFGLDLPFARSTPVVFWHAHEMIFGAWGGALLGFITTAVPEWSDTRRPKGRTLFVLAALWGLGRLVGFFGADVVGLLGALADAGWLAALAGYAARIAWLRRSGVLAGFAALLGGLFALEVATRWSFAVQDFGASQRLLHAAGFLFLGLLGLALGRIGVAVNNRILDPSRVTTPYRPHPGRLHLASGLAALAAVGELAGFSTAVSGYLLLAAGAGFMDRTAESFIGRRSFRAEVLVLAGASLFAGTGLIVTGLGRLGLPVAPGVGLHLALMGGLGLGVMAVFSIAGLLHTGRELRFPRGAKLAATLLVLAVLARVLPQLGWMPILPGRPFTLAALLWAGAFLAWLRAYWPFLAGPETLAAREEGALL